MRKRIRINGILYEALDDSIKNLSTDKRDTVQNDKKMIRSSWSEFVDKFEEFKEDLSLVNEYLPNDANNKLSDIERAINNFDSVTEWLKDQVTSSF